MKIAIPLQSGGYGGAEVYTIRLATAMLRLGFQPTILSAPDTRLHGESRSADIDFVPLDLGGKLSRATAVYHVAHWLRHFHDLRKALLRLEPAAILLQFKLEELLLPGEMHSIATILEHGPIPTQLLHLPMMRHRLSKLYENANRVLAVSPAAARSMSALTSSRTPPPVVGAGGMQSQRSYSPTRGPGRRASPPTLAYVGRLAENKGVLKLIELVLLRDVATLIIAGSGPLEPVIARYAEAYPRTISYLGYVQDVSHVLRQADALVLLSSDPGEGWPLSVLEALELGTPVIASSHPVLQEMSNVYGHEWVRLWDGQEEATFWKLATASSPEEPPALPMSWETVARRVLALEI